MKRLIVCDPGLVDVHGHHFDFNVALAAAASAAKLEIAFLSNTQFTDPIGDLRPIGLFTHSIYEASPEFAASAETTVSGPALSTFAEELAFGLDLLQATNEDVVFIHTADLVLIWSLFDFFIVRESRNTPTMAVLIRYEKSPNGIPYPAWLPSAIRDRYVNSGVIGERFFLYGETQGLSQWLTQVTGLPCEWLPHVSQRAEAPAMECAPKTGKLNVVYAGEARLEKGFDQLPLILDRLARKPELAARLKFRIQADSGKAGTWDAVSIRSTRDRIRSYEISGLVEVLARLSDDEFYDLLCEADVLLLPYTPASYKYRGSGIFAEAELLGIPILVKNGTSMAQEMGPGSGIVISDPGDAVEALSRIAADYPAWRNAAAANAMQARKVRSMPGLIDRLAALTLRRDAASAAFARVALHVAPLWSGQGGSYVFQAQIDYLINRGFVVFCAHLQTWDEPPQAAISLHRRFAEQSVGVGASYHWWLSRPEAKRDLEKRRGIPPEFSLEEERKWALDATLPPTLLEALAAHKPDVVVINYSHNVPLVERLGVQNVPVVVETLDIRTNQYVLASKTPLEVSVEYEKEWRHTARGDAAVFINVEELNYFLAASSYRKPAMAVTPMVTETRKRTLPCDLMLQMMRYDSGVTVEVDKKEPIILFVGTPHLANLISFEWFYAEVFVPHLQGKGLSLVVAGSISRQYADYNLPGVIFLGHVPDLRCIYDLATVVVLPIVAGTGQPIKAIDAVRMRKSFVATSKAFAGTPDLARCFEAHDTPQEFARAVIDLATSSERRERLLGQIDSALTDVLQQEIYHAAWDRLFTGIGIDTKGRGSETPDLDLTEAYARGAISSPIKVDCCSPKLTIREVSAERYLAIDFEHDADVMMADLTLISVKPFDAILRLNGLLAGRRTFCGGRNSIIIPASPTGVSSIEMAILNGADIDIKIDTQSLERGSVG